MPFISQAVIAIDSIRSRLSNAASLSGRSRGKVHWSIAWGGTFIMLFALSAVPAHPQTPSENPAPPARDTNFTMQPSGPEGAEILERAIAAGGGRRAWKELVGFRASGEFSLYSGNQVSEKGRATLAGSGLTQFKLTADLANETRAWILNNGRGVATVQNTTASIGPHNFPALEGITLPIKKLIGLLDRASLPLLESTEFNGRTVYRVRIVRVPAYLQSKAKEDQQGMDIHILVDPESFTILAIEDTIFPNSYARESYTHRVLYGDYREIAGVSIPFSIKEEISANLTWGLELDSFQANAAVSNAEFELKSSGQR